MNIYENIASDFITAIKALAEKPQNLENFKHYLAYHFPKWLEIWANTPEKITAELKQFAEMEI